MQFPFIIFLTGSSGAGKTTLLKAFADKYPSKQNSYLYFDHIGVPSNEEMIKLFGSPEEWQRAMTNEWIQKICSEYSEKKLVILEVQVRPSFIIESCEKNNLSDFQIILIHCNKAIRDQRLIQNRNQPELANNEMENWSQYLKDQAVDLNIPILDTSKIDLDAALQFIINQIKLSITAFFNSFNLP